MMRRPLRKQLPVKKKNLKPQLIKHKKDKHSKRKNYDRKYEIRKIPKLQKNNQVWIVTDRMLEKIVE